MGERVVVRVVATDAVSEMGVRAQLRGRPELRLLETECIEAVAVTLVVADEVDETAVRMMREARCGGRSAVVLVATRIDDGGLLAAVEAGAGAIVPRCEATPERLTAAVVSVAEGRGDVSSDLLGRLLHQVGNLQRTVLASRGLGPSGLSDREVQVLRLVADGADTSEIASSLAYSERTVKNVIHDITTRLQLRNRAHAVAYAVRHGLI
jgi:DNA-binding NarL/FixJ family response regulator